MCNVIEVKCPCCDEKIILNLSLASLLNNEEQEEGLEKLNIDLG